MYEIVKGSIKVIGLAVFIVFAILSRILLV